MGQDVTVNPASAIPDLVCEIVVCFDKSASLSFSHHCCNPNIAESGLCSMTFCKGAQVVI
jgi:hypothetical protein